MNVLIIGGGNMGRSFAESFLNAKILTHKQLTVIEKDHAQIQELNRMKLGQVYNDYGDFIEEKDLIILATKPQDAYSVYPKLQPYITNKHIVLTIMAGVPIADVCRKFGVSEATFFRWKTKYVGLELSDLKKMKGMEAENSSLRRLVADQALQIHAMKEVLKKKF